MLNLKKQLTQLIEHMNQAVDDAYKRGYEKGKAESADSAYAEGYTNAESNFREMRDQMDQESYQRGLDDAWEAARKIALPELDGGYSYDELDECFGEMRGTVSMILKNALVTEVVKTISEYEERKAKEDEEIKIGDELRNIHSGQRVIVTRVLNSGDYFNAVGIRSYDKKFGTWDDQSVSHWKKTGRHVDLSELFGGEEE